MPRPKRTKVAPSAPAPRVRQSSKSTPQPEAPAQPPKAPFNDLYDLSDPEDRVVTSVQRVKKTMGKEVAQMTIATPMRKQTPDNMQAGGLDTASGDVNAMLEDLIQASSSPEIEMGRRERATPGIDSSVLAISKFKRRPRQQSILGRGPSRARSSSVSSNLANDNGLTTVGRRDTSTLAGGKPKRKPRELSVGRAPVAVLPSSIVLQMGTPAHVGSALKIANFKRRAREPSILGTAQKAQSQRLQYDDDDEDEDEEEGEDDFNPDDESTPLKLSKSKVMSSSSVPSSFNSRKRKLSAVQVPRSSPILPSPRHALGEEVIPSTETRQDEENEDSEADEAVDEDGVPLPSIEARPHTPELLSDTMAPPRSSSSSAPSPQMPSRIPRAPSRARRPPRNRTPPPGTQDSPISSPPSLTHSPNRPPLHMSKPKPKKAAPPPSTLSTAQLQALLPRRRRRAARDPFDIPSSEDEVDVSGLAPEDDELSHISVRPRSRRGNTMNRTVAPIRRVAKGKQVAKAKEPIPKRTYGSRENQASDKENEAQVEADDSLAPIPDDGGEVEGSENSQEMEKRVGKELKRAAKKFKEVDKWELEFEEITASSSSPRERDAR